MAPFSVKVQHVTSDFFFPVTLQPSKVNFAREFPCYIGVRYLRHVLIIISDVSPFSVKVQHVTSTVFWPVTLQPLLLCICELVINHLLLITGVSPFSVKVQHGTRNISYASHFTTFLSNYRARLSLLYTVKTSEALFSVYIPGTSPLTIKKCKMSCRCFLSKSLYSLHLLMLCGTFPSNVRVRHLRDLYVCAASSFAIIKSET